MKLKFHSFFFAIFATAAFAGDSAAVPEEGPRTFILAGERQAFREFCLTGPAKDFYTKLKSEFDTKWLHVRPPSEPQEYGDPAPNKRKGEKVDKWRAAQSTANQLAGTAEAATVIWLVTDGEEYLDQARKFLLAGCAWSTEEPGETRIDYNDESHFRLWRKLPFVFDQIRNELTSEQRGAVIESFRRRGDDSFALIKKRTEDTVRNSLKGSAKSHPIRFVSMTGLAGLALYDDLPEARDWFDYALKFYRDKFPAWGGDDGGWAEGTAYWRGNIEHARFQDALVAINHPDAYANPFWRQTGYFPLYFVQPYKHTAFGDTPVQGKFNLEPMVADLELRLARQFQDGYLRSYAELADTSQRSLESQGLYFVSETYPAGMEYILRDFASRRSHLPPAKPLAELPPARWFRDVGWVGIHSVLGQPDKDIMLSFKSSPFASFSHSHADQNAFILNAYGENLLVNAGYREFHHSPHHTGYTEQTASKNAILIGDEGQKSQSETATGKILGLEFSDRIIWTVGDSAAAYNDGRGKPIVKEARREILMVDKRYFVIRDLVDLEEPRTVSWLLHAESPISWDSDSALARIQQPKAGCEVALLTTTGGFEVTVTKKFPVPVDPKYGWPEQSHLTATTTSQSAKHTILAVIWPWPGSDTPTKLLANWDGQTLKVQRPDGRSDSFDTTSDRLSLLTPNQNTSNP